MALHLVYFEGFAPAEAARILKKSAKQVYNLLSRARASLKTILTQEGHSYEDL